MPLPEFKGPDPVKLAPLLAGQRMMGVIRSYNQATGFGFIVCAETDKIFGADVFIQREDAEPAGATVGATVSFTVEVEGNKGGRPKARNIIVEMPGVKKESELEAQVNEMLFELASKQLDRSYIGFIKSFNQSNGFGFISCEETARIFGRDIFLHHSNLGGFNVGDAVSFKLDIDLEKATPKAQDLAPPPPDAAEQLASGKKKGTASMKGAAGHAARLEIMQRVGMMTAMSSMSQMASMGDTLEKLLAEGDGIEGVTAAGMSNIEWAREMVKKREKTKDTQSTMTRLQKLVDEKKRFVGIIRTFNRARGFGFIACDETHKAYGSDIFLHNEQREGFEVGDVISFGIDVRGNQARARDVQASTGPEDRGEVAPGRQNQPNDRFEDRAGAPPKRNRDRSRSRSRSRSRRRR